MIVKVKHILTYIQVLGVKGPSWLTLAPTFDLIKGVSVDYMHCCLLGVCRLMLRLWLQSSHHNDPWYMRSKLQELDARLAVIHPPDEIQRTPRGIESTVAHWKGTGSY